MRPLEIILVLATAAALLRVLSGRVEAAALPAVAVLAILVLQVSMEGARWQMLPAYVVAALLAPALMVAAAGAPWLFRLPLLVCGGGLLAAATVLSLVLPVFRLPPPTGPFAVGTVTVALQAASPVQTRLWYPATAAPGLRTAPYQSGVASLAGRYRDLVRTHALVDAPFASVPAPARLILCLPGWGGRRTDNTALAEDLASHGYVVASIDDPVPMGAMEFGSADAYAGTLSRSAAKAAKEARVVLQVLDGLAGLAAADPRFDGRFVTDRVGVVGFSFGGTAGATAARLDPRIRAVVNMDGWLFGDAATQGVPVPYMMLNDDEQMPDKAALESPDPVTRYTAELNVADWQAQNRAVAQHGGYIVTLRGTQHNNFTDAAFRSPLRRLSGGGPVDPRRSEALMREYCLAFFDRILRGMPAPLLDPARAPDGVFFNLAQSWPES